MYGLYKAPFKVEAEGFSVSTTVENDMIMYRREVHDDVFEKPLLCDCTQFLIEPVEPVNLPENITEYFLIEFEKAMLVKPHSKHILFLKIPIEIGVFIGEKDDLLGHKIKAFVSLGDHANLGDKEIADFCAERLPNYMVPHTIVFLDDLPRTLNEKVDRVALKRG